MIIVFIADNLFNSKKCVFTKFIKVAFNIYLFMYLFIYREGEEKKERNINVLLVASHTPLLGTWPSNPGMCPDWESNHQPFGS